MVKNTTFEEGIVGESESKISLGKKSKTLTKKE
jgi:hypothetical protein